MPGPNENVPSSEIGVWGGWRDDGVMIWGRLERWDDGYRQTYAIDEFPLLCSMGTVTSPQAYRHTCCGYLRHPHVPQRVNLLHDFPAVRLYDCTAQASKRVVLVDLAGRELSALKVKGLPRPEVRGGEGRVPAGSSASGPLRRDAGCSGAHWRARGIRH